MTQPIGEPLIQRAVTYGAWRSNQLERRPMPLAPGSMWGVPDLILSGGGTTIPTDTTWPIPWIDFATPHTYGTGVISDADGELFVLEITDDGDPGEDRWEVTSRREGWWANECITQWDQVATAGTNDIASVRQRIYWTDVSGFAFSPTEYRDSYDWMITGGAGGAIDSFGFMDNSYIRTWIAPHYIPSTKTWQSVAIQRTGTSRGMSGIKWAWWFIAADDLDAWTFETI